MVIHKIFSTSVAFSIKSTDTDLLIKSGAHQPQAGAPGFLVLLLSANVCMRVCVFVCVSAPEAINN